VHDREELVLHLGAAARDLVEEDRLRVPQRRRRAKVLQAVARVVRHGEAEQVVEGDQTRVVVAVLEAERACDAVEQRRLRAAVRADEQQRLLGGERGDDDRVQMVEAVQAETAKRVGAHSSCSSLAASAMCPGPQAGSNPPDP
jgi:hypothetical protein